MEFLIRNELTFPQSYSYLSMTSGENSFNDKIQGSWPLQLTSWTTVVSIKCRILVQPKGLFLWQSDSHGWGKRFAACCLNEHYRMRKRNGVVNYLTRWPKFSLCCGWCDERKNVSSRCDSSNCDFYCWSLCFSKLVIQSIAFFKTSYQLFSGFHAHRTFHQCMRHARPALCKISTLYHLHL